MIVQDKNFGDNLRKLRNKHGFSQGDLVREMHFYGSTLMRESYSAIERGQRNIKITDVVILKTIYDCSFEDIFAGIIAIPKSEDLN